MERDLLLFSPKSRKSYNTGTYIMTTLRHILRVTIISAAAEATTTATTLAIPYPATKHVAEYSQLERCYSASVIM